MIIDMRSEFLKNKYLVLGILLLFAVCLWWSKHQDKYEKKADKWWEGLGRKEDYGGEGL